MISTDTPNTETSSPSKDALAWNDELLRNPHAVAEKRGRVQRMFAAIAPSYDLNNRLHSLWMDQHWRRTAVKLANVSPADSIVDIACGTGDLTLKFAQAACDATNRGQGFGQHVLPPRDRVLGIDFTYEMLPIARHKAAATRPPCRCRMAVPISSRSPSASATFSTPPPPSANSSASSAPAADC
jgi:SAM-dependent methyltransferase